MSEFTVKIFLFFVLSSSLFGAKKLSLAVLRLEAGPSVSKEIAVNAREAIFSNFLSSGRFELIPEDTLNKIPEVFKLEGLLETRQAVKAGRTLDAKRLLIGSISRTNDRHYLSLRLIDVEQSKISLSDSWSAPKGSDLIRIAARVFAEIEARTPLLGQIIKVNDQTTVLLDLGEEDGVRKDYAVSFLRFGEEIREPVGGESLGREVTSLGKGKIKSFAGGQMSTAIIITHSNRLIWVILPSTTNIGGQTMMFTTILLSNATRSPEAFLPSRHSFSSSPSPKKNPNPKSSKPVF